VNRSTAKSAVVAVFAGIHINVFDIKQFESLQVTQPKSEAASSEKREDDLDGSTARGRSEWLTIVESR